MSGKDSARRPTRGIPNYAKDNIANVLPSYTNAESDYVKASFQVGNFKSLASLPTRIAANLVNEQRANIADQNITSAVVQAPYGSYRIIGKGAKPNFDYFEYMPSEYSLVDELKAKQNQENREKRKQFCDKEWVYASVNPQAKVKTLPVNQISSLVQKKTGFKAMDKTNSSVDIYLKNMRQHKDEDPKKFAERVQKERIRREEHERTDQLRRDVNAVKDIVTAILACIFSLGYEATTAPAGNNTKPKLPETLKRASEYVAATAHDGWVSSMQRALREKEERDRDIRKVEAIAQDMKTSVSKMPSYAQMGLVKYKDLPAADQEQKRKLVTVFFESVHELEFNFTPLTNLKKQFDHDHEVLYHDPFEDSNSVELREKWISAAKILHGPFIPAPQDQSLKGLAHKGMLPDIMRALAREIDGDWEDAEFQIYRDEEDLIIIEFNISSVTPDMQGLVAYMNIMVGNNPVVSENGLSKIVELWNHQPGDGSVYYAFKGPWVKRSGEESYYTLHPERRNFRTMQQYEAQEEAKKQAQAAAAEKMTEAMGLK